MPIEVEVVRVCGGSGVGGEEIAPTAVAADKSRFLNPGVSGARGVDVGWR